MQQVRHLYVVLSEEAGAETDKSKRGAGVGTDRDQDDSEATLNF